MRYAKLNNGILEFAPLNYKNILNFNRNVPLMRENGFKKYYEDTAPSYNEDYQRLDISFKEDENTITKTYIIVNFRTKSEAEAEHKEKEQLRVQELSMSKSDFFDGMIRAFGLDQNDLQPAIQLVLNNIGISDIDKKIAMNNYTNAKDFYRKHTLFTLLSDREIPVSETQSIKISSSQWDRFFIETDNKNSEAYKELLS